MESLCGRAVCARTTGGQASVRRTWMRCGALALAVFGPAAIGSAQVAAIRAAVQEAEDLGVRTGIAVLDTSGPKLVWAHRSREAFVPASNQKLVTAVAALHRLGAEHRFRTVFRVREGVLEVSADGDPSWQTGSAHDPAEAFARVAAALRQHGLTTLRGVRLDAGGFGGPDRPATWPSNQFHLPYCAPSSAHVLDASCLRVAIDPDRGGRNAAVRVVAPPVDLPFRGAIELTADKKRGGKFGFALRGDAIRLWGHFLRGAPARVEEIAIDDPPALYERALRAALRRGGIEVADGAGPADASAAGRTEAVEFEHVELGPLLPALRTMLVESSNVHAEQVFRHLATVRRDRGTFAAGVAEVRDTVAALVPGLDDGVVVADGSGLSRENRITPRALALLLEAGSRSAHGELRREAPGRDASNQPTRPPSTHIAAHLRDLLPRPGEGTLRGRFDDRATERVAPHVRAKTGWIRGASALSGYVGAHHVFVILMNYDPKRGGLNRRHLKPLQERIVAAIGQLAG